MVEWSLSIPAFLNVLPKKWQPSKAMIVGSAVAAIALGFFVKYFGAPFRAYFYEVKNTEETIRIGKLRLIRLKGTGKYNTLWKLVEYKKKQF